MTTKKISIEEATPQQLKEYATTILGIADVKPSQNKAQVIALIHAVDPNITEIEVEDKAPPAPPPPAIDKPVEQAAPSGDRKLSAIEELEAMVADPDEVDDNSWMNDPRVSVKFSESHDETKPKIVQLAVNGVAFAYKRGVVHQIPYSVFLANLNGRETVSRETGEDNSAGMPIRENVEQLSYPMESIVLPDLAAIAAWHKAEGSRPPEAVMEIVRQMQRAA